MGYFDTVSKLFSFLIVDCVVLADIFVYLFTWIYLRILVVEAEASDAS